MNRASLLPTPNTPHPGRFWPWFILPVLLFAIGLGFALPKEARADPHAVFYTDNGFKQVFYAVLAALNQADYVEPPGQPKNLDPNPPKFTEFDGKPDLDAVQLPRIRVRAVTPDDGDVYYRQIVLEEKRVIRALGNLNSLSCKIIKWLKPSEYQEHQCSRSTGNS